MVLRLGQGDINFVDDKLPFHFPLMRRTASDLTEPYQATVPERLLMDSEQNSAERADRKLLVSRITSTSRHIGRREVGSFYTGQHPIAGKHPEEDLSAQSITIKL